MAIDSTLVGVVSSSAEKLPSADSGSGDAAAADAGPFGGVLDKAFGKQVSEKKERKGNDLPAAGNPLPPADSIETIGQKAVEADTGATEAKLADADAVFAKSVSTAVDPTSVSEEPAETTPRHPQRELTLHLAAEADDPVRDFHHSLPSFPGYENAEVGDRGGEAKIPSPADTVGIAGHVPVSPKESGGKGAAVEKPFTEASNLGSIPSMESGAKLEGEIASPAVSDLRKAAVEASGEKETKETSFSMVRNDRKEPFSSSRSGELVPPREEKTKEGEAKTASVATARAFMPSSTASVSPVGQGVEQTAPPGVESVSTEERKASASSAKISLYRAVEEKKEGQRFPRESQLPSSSKPAHRIAPFSMEESPSQQKGEEKKEGPSPTERNLPEGGVHRSPPAFSTERTAATMEHSFDIGVQPQQDLRSRSAAPPAPSPHHASSAAVSAGSSAEVQIEPPLGHRAWEESMARHTLKMAGEGVSKATLHLNPSSLGSIHVQVRTKGDEAHVQFQSQHALVREAVETALPRLRELFHGSGFQHLEVQVSSQGYAGGGGFGQGNGQGAMGGTGQERGSSTAMGGSWAEMSVEEPAGEEGAAIPVSASGRLDYYL